MQHRNEIHKVVRVRLCQKIIDNTYNPTTTNFKYRFHLINFALAATGPVRPTLATLLTFTLNVMQGSALSLLT